MKPSILLADLARCEPSAAISRDGRAGTWLAVDYQIDEGPGTMLIGLPGSGAPELTFHLGVAGWHEVRLGIYYGTHAGMMEERTLCAKLTGDVAFSRFRREDFRAVKDGDYPEKVLGPLDIAEAFWKCADLTGKDLVVARPPRGEMAATEACLAYVRLVPMDDAAVTEWRSEEPRPETRRLVANYDGGSFGQWGVSTPEDYVAEFDCLRESDFAIVLYAVARGPITFYPSRVGEFMRPSGHYGAGQVLRQSVANGCHPLAEAIRAARECGVALFPQNRFEGPQMPPKHVRADYGGQFMADHPEWLCRYADGEPTRHLSFAYDGVRAFYVRMFREWVEDYGADGINLLFSRSYPFVYYEEPVCAAFRARYGEDMRALPVSDERAQQVRAAFVTQFVREIRAMLDEVGAAQGRRIPTCYNVPVGNSPSNIPDAARASGRAECLFNALDVAAWIAEGLVDHLVVHAHAFGGHDGTALQPRVREFTHLARGTRTRVYVDVYPRRMPARQYRKIAMSYYAAGADGLAFWDSYNRYMRASEWAFIKRLGHRDDLARWHGKGDDWYRVVPLRRLDGFLTGREFSLPSDG